MSVALRAPRGLSPGFNRDESRPGDGHPPELPPCPRCGLFHNPVNHDRPVNVYAGPGRCTVCRELRCDRPGDCRFAHAGESREDYRDRMAGV